MALGLFYASHLKASECERTGCHGLRPGNDRLGLRIVSGNRSPISPAYFSRSMV
jgi:hypothetical protein